MLLPFLFTGRQKVLPAGVGQPGDGLQQGLQLQRQCWCHQPSHQGEQSRRRHRSRCRMGTASDRQPLLFFPPSFRDVALLFDAQAAKSAGELLNRLQSPPACAHDPPSPSPLSLSASSGLLSCLEHSVDCGQQVHVKQSSMYVRHRSEVFSPQGESDFAMRLRNGGTRPFCCYCVPRTKK